MKIMYSYNHILSDVVKWSLLFYLFTFLPLSVSSQSDARTWIKKGEWTEGFAKAKPHKSLNISEFYSQYKKNPEQWQTLFRWLRDTDLLTIPKGKHPIPGSTLVASVEPGIGCLPFGMVSRSVSLSQLNKVFHCSVFF